MMPENYIFNFLFQVYFYIFIEILNKFAKNETTNHNFLFEISCWNNTTREEDIYTSKQDWRRISLLYLKGHGQDFG